MQKLRKNYAKITQKKLRKNYAYVCKLHNLHYYAPPTLLMITEQSGVCVILEITQITHTRVIFA